MNNPQSMEIGDSTLPLGHSLLLNNEKPKKLVTFSMPRSSLFESLNSFLPQFKQSCEEVEREIAETGTTHLAVEEFISDESDESDRSRSSSSSNTSDSSDNSDSSDHSNYSEDSNDPMSVEDESQIPSVEMRLALAPMDAVEAIEKAEQTLSDPTQVSTTPLVKEM